MTVRAYFELAITIVKVEIIARKRSSGPKRLKIFMGILIYR